MIDIIPTPKANIIMDASQLDLFELCEARYNYRYNLHKTLPVIQKARGLDLGGLAHEGFEAYYKGLRDGKHFNDRLEDSFTKIRVKASDVNESNQTVEETEGLIKVIHQNLE